FQACFWCIQDVALLALCPIGAAAGPPLDFGVASCLDGADEQLMSSLLDSDTFVDLVRDCSLPRLYQVLLFCLGSYGKPLLRSADSFSWTNLVSTLEAIRSDP